jgi:thioredoxin-like negative regulator of GroEL
MRVALFVLIASLIGSQVFSDTRSSGALKTEIKDQVFRATLKDGFHFNDKAPNALVLDNQTLKPTKLANHEAEFSNLPKSWGKGRASLYVCDDAVTFCESQVIDLKGTGGASAKSPSSSNPHKGSINRYGFIEDDFNKALSLAKKKNQLVLVDFSARWCPGCLRLESETLETKDFKNLTKEFVKLRLDVDRFENIVLSEKFNVKGIPTLLVLNSAQEEVDRIVDYQPPVILNRFFSTVAADPLSIRELTERAKTKDPMIVEKLAKRLVASGRYKESLPYFSQIQPTPPEFLYAKVETASAEHKADPAKKAQYIQVLQDAIRAEPTSSRSISWRTELVGLLDDKVEKKKIMNEGVKLADTLLADSEKLKDAMKTDQVGEFTNFEPLMIAMNRADLIESSEADAPDVSQAWLKAADVGRNLKISPKQTGPALRQLIVLIQARLFDEADGLVQKLLKLSPGNPELQRRRLKILIGLKKYPEAIRLGEVTLKKSFDRNEFWVAESLAKAYVESKKYKEAQILLDRYLNRNDIEWSNIKSVYKGMKELRSQIPSETSGT